MHFYSFGLITIYMRLPESKSISRRTDVCANDVLGCLLGLRDLESKAYWTLLSGGCGTVELAQKLDRDRTSIQRALSNLVSAGLVARKPLPVKKGRKYAYQAISVSQLKRFLNDELENYRSTMAEKIKSLEKPLQDTL